MKNIKGKLLSIKKEYEEILNGVTEGLNLNLTEGISELSLYDNHPADIASELFEREKDLGTKIYIEKQIDKIDDALEKLENGKYGICDECGKSILKERLEALPFTTKCVQCQEKHNSGIHSQYNNKASRPVEEGMIFLRDDINPQFDGEDVWQQVAYYGTSETPNEIGAIDYKHMYVDYNKDKITDEE